MDDVIVVGNAIYGLKTQDVLVYGLRWGAWPRNVCADYAVIRAVDVGMCLSQGLIDPQSAVSQNVLEHGVRMVDDVSSRRAHNAQRWRVITAQNGE